jgi:hypothetical protein
MTQLTPREWEQLSAYLDNQLNPHDRARLEHRLKGDPDLTRDLVDLRKTCLILRNSPKLRAPRNFSLTPNMAGVKRGSRPLMAAYPILGLTSVLATVFFVLITAGSLVIRNATPPQAMISSSQMDNARQAPEFGMGGGGGGGGSPVEPPAMLAAPTQEMLTLGAESATENPSAKALVVTPLAREAVAPTLDQVQAFTLPQESLQVDAPPAVVDPSANTEGIPSQPARSSWNAWLLILLLQVFLALIAVISGIAALYFRRTSI